MRALHKYVTREVICNVAGTCSTQRGKFIRRRRSHRRTRRRSSEGKDTQPEEPSSRGWLRASRRESSRDRRRAQFVIAERLKVDSLRDRGGCRRIKLLRGIPRPRLPFQIILAPFFSLVFSPLLARRSVQRVRFASKGRFRDARVQSAQCAIYKSRLRKRGKTGALIQVACMARAIVSLAHIIKMESPSWRNDRCGARAADDQVREITGTGQANDVGLRYR